MYELFLLLPPLSNTLTQSSICLRFLVYFFPLPLCSHFTKFSWAFEYNGVSNMLTLQNRYETEVCI